MKKVKIPKNRIRKLKTFSLGKKSFELLSSNSQNKKLIDLCSNDYFGLSRDKDLIKAAYEISLLEGIGSGSSRFITGSRPIHKLLETEQNGISLITWSIFLLLIKWLLLRPICC